MIPIPISAFFNREIVAINCISDMNYEIWIILFQEWWDDFEELVIGAFERFWMSNDTD